MHSARVVGRLASVASTSIAALYAWGVTVAPVVWGRAHVSWVAELAAVAGPLVLAFGIPLESRFGTRARSPCLWGFTMACGVCWASAATPGDPLLDATYVMAGVLAWGVFALSWAAPPLEVSGGKPRAFMGIPKAADPFPRAALASAACGVAVAVGLQLVAFDAKSPERALLFRLMAVAAGLAAVGVFAKVGLASFGRGRRR